MKMLPTNQIELILFFCSASGAGQGSIDNRIEQAMVSFIC